MPSLVTGIIGGIQGRNAAKNASREQVAAAMKAAGIIDQATGEVNPQILDAAMQAIGGVAAASEQAAGGVESAAEQARVAMNDAVRTGNAYLDPYRSAGQDAVTRLSDLVQRPVDVNLDADPGYQFRLQQQQRAIERSAAAKGGVLGGGTLRALARYSGDLASQEYSNAWQRAAAEKQAKTATLADLVRLGMGAADTSGGRLIAAAGYGGDTGREAARLAGGIRLDAARYAGDTRMSAVNTVAANRLRAAGYRADAETEAGNALAAGHVGAANAWNGMLSQFGKTGDAMLAGGLSGGRGFSLRGMASYGRRI